MLTEVCMNTSMWPSFAAVAGLLGKVVWNEWPAGLMGHVLTFCSRAAKKVRAFKRQNGKDDTRATIFGRVRPLMGEPNPHVNQ